MYGFCAIRISVISRKVLLTSIARVNLKIILFELLQLLAGASGFSCQQYLRGGSQWYHYGTTNYQHVPVTCEPEVREANTLTMALKVNIILNLGFDLYTASVLLMFIVGARRAEIYLLPRNQRI